MAGMISRQRYCVEPKTKKTVSATGTTNRVTPCRKYNSKSGREHSKGRICLVESANILLCGGGLSKGVSLPGLFLISSSLWVSGGERCPPDIGVQS